MDYEEWYIVEDGEIIDKIIRDPHNGMFPVELEYGNIRDYVWETVNVVNGLYIDDYLLGKMQVHKVNNMTVLPKDNGDLIISMLDVGYVLEELIDFNKNTGLGIESYLEYSAIMVEL